jgi:ParB family chromosome partitioning protein
MTDAREIREIPIERIDVLNPRVRNQKIFRELVASIQALGLKKPVTVTPREGPDGERYGLVCGQGRLEAFQALGQTTIPALVVDATDEDAFVMSLVENIARRQPRPAEILVTIRALQHRGYDPTTIASKTALHHSYVRGVLLLLGKGEERLVAAVEAGRMPLSTAIDIVKAEGDDARIQTVLHDAYESGALRVKKLLTVRRLIEQRRALGKMEGRPVPGKHKGGVQLSSTLLVRAYNQEVERQKLLIRKADLVQHRLAFVAAALANMLTDENFVNVLRAEGLDTLPKPLEERVRAGGAVS